MVDRPSRRRDYRDQFNVDVGSWRGGGLLGQCGCFSVYVLTSSRERRRHHRKSLGTKRQTEFAQLYWASVFIASGPNCLHLGLCDYLDDRKKSFPFLRCYERIHGLRQSKASLMFPFGQLSRFRSAVQNLALLSPPERPSSRHRRLRPRPSLRDWLNQLGAPTLSISS